MKLKKKITYTLKKKKNLSQVEVELNDVTINSNELY